MATAPKSETPAFARSPLALALGMLILIALCLWSALPQIEAPRTAAGTPWRAETGAAIIQDIVGDGAAHPTGSAANDAVRARIVTRLRAAGYAPVESQHFQCFSRRRGSGCTQLTNIVAVREGASANAPAILATAHYDSVPAGPGVADDLAGTAVMLGLAEHLATAPPSRNAIVFLFTDSEETGLRGAAAFAENDPLMSRIGVVINVEARGVSGPSMLFETGPENANLVRFYAQHVRNKIADSLSFEVYKILPNDTDFSVYSLAGLNGFNFAIAGSASLYHSQRDDLAHLDRNSLQHHGDNVFALAPALADADLASLQATSNVSYTVFPWGLSVWPSEWNAPLAALALIALIAAAVLARRGLGLGWRAWAWSLASLILAPAALFALGWLISYPLAIWPGAQPLITPRRGRAAWRCLRWRSSWRLGSADCSQAAAIGARISSRRGSRSRCFRSPSRSSRRAPSRPSCFPLCLPVSPRSWATRGAGCYGPPRSSVSPPWPISGSDFSCRSKWCSVFRKARCAP